MSKWVKFEELLGKILTKIEVTNSKDEILFYTDEGNTYKMYHEQDCCESVTIDDINGDLDNLIGNPILIAEESTNSDGVLDWVLIQKHAASASTKRYSASALVR